MIYHHWHVIGPVVIVAPRAVAPAAAGVPYFSVLKVATLTGTQLPNSYVHQDLVVILERQSWSH